MGILNVTPDSFSDGGNFVSADSSYKQVSKMLDEGASIIDVGGESTRPGAAPVGVAEELDRVIPVIERIASEFDVTISIDTSKAEVMSAAVAAGAHIINDVRALREPDALETAATLGVPVCLMHMLGEPRQMQLNPQYADVVADVKTFLLTRVEACVQAGIKRDNIWLDPGFGFGKTLEHNLQLMHGLETFQDLGLPVLVGVSRKSMIAKMLDDRSVDDRLFASLSLATIALMKGARILRVHDVRATMDALVVAQCVLRAGN